MISVAQMNPALVAHGPDDAANTDETGSQTSPGKTEVDLEPRVRDVLVAEGVELASPCRRISTCKRVPT